MTLRSKTFAWQRVSLLAFAAATVAISDVRPAEADYTRSCTAILEVRPSGTSTARKAYRWSVRNTVTHYYQVNEARREARRDHLLRTGPLGCSRRRCGTVCLPIARQPRSP